MRIALFGDVGGHAALLADALERLGADVAAGWLPDGLAVVQVGDLIDRGPDSAGCVALAERFLVGSPGRWVQLFGNHEGNRLGGPRFWDEPLDGRAEATLQGWWAGGRVALATGIRSYLDGDLLVTHGGLVARLWDLLGRPDLAGTVAALNRWVGDDPALAFAPGALLPGVGAGLPGPAWPDAGRELYPSWEDRTDVPFGQIHGHSTVADWRTARTWRGVPRSVKRAVALDPESRTERIVLGGRPFVGIDPTLGTDPGDALLVPLIVNGDLIP